MEVADKSGPAPLETSTVAGAESTATGRRHKKHKTRGGKHHRDSDGSDGGLRSNESAHSENTTKARKRHSRKAHEDGAKELVSPPADSPGSASAGTQDAPSLRPPITAALPEEPPHAPLAPPLAADKEGAVPPTEERNPNDVLLVSIVTCVVMVSGLALVVAGIVLGLMIPHPGPGCPPLHNQLQEGTIMVSTRVGRLIGRTIVVDGVRLSQLLGVSFAVSTAGERRFELPIPLTVTNPCLVRDCAEPREPCPQVDANGTLVGSEDCLHVNVWIPETPPPVGTSRALVVALDGFWFERGSNDHPDWPRLAAKGDVVVVAPNHRLGVFGFLNPPKYAGDKEVAVDDVVSALHWARDNAAAFHADPDGLVVVGRGSGAYLLSTALRRMPNNTASRALYHGLVYGSLLPLKPQGPTEIYSQLATALHCNTTENMWLPCYRDAPVEKLLTASRASRLPMRYAPQLDLSMLKKPGAAWPHTVLAGSDAADVRVLFTDTIVPLAKEANASTPQAVLDFTLGVFNIDPYLRPIILEKIQISSIEGVLHNLPLVMGLCPTLNVAQAVPEGFHYYYDSVAVSTSFRPPLGVEQVAEFAAKGIVPPLGYGSPWPPLKTTSKTRVIEEKGRENFTSFDSLCKNVY